MYRALLTRYHRQDVWPEAKFAALGAFIFLRYKLSDITLVILADDLQKFHITGNCLSRSC